MNTNEKIIERLNDLLTKNYDSEAGYKQAAEQTDSVALRQLFTRRSEQRYRFGHEIKAEIKALGGTPDKGTSVLGDLHRGWINIKSALSFDTEEAILEECERGEESCLEEYNEVLADTTLPTSTRTLLEKQRDSVRNALNQVDKLEEAVD